MTSAKSLLIDSYNATDRSGGTVESSPVRFAEGTSYTVKVEGTFSAWDVWGHRRCGLPEPGPVFLSPASDHVATTVVGDDAVFRFARPLSTGTCKSKLPSLPYAQVGLQINLGSGWKNFLPDGGVPAKPTANNHAYTETIVGVGTVPKFRIPDWRTADNNGQLKITIH